MLSVITCVFYLALSPLSTGAPVKHTTPFYTEPRSFCTQFGAHSPVHRKQRFHTGPIVIVKHGVPTLLLQLRILCMF